ncbi:hypothetical protein Tco_0628469 [Tanacetum coccineum]|uniref:Uncharacterized protein n=1 Tax=Tanacetum coccineum TaxID=301880 RepID=A0ABQ4WQH0_9ASTR
MAIREPIVEATRPLPVVEGKGKAIATEEQAAQSLLALHTPKRRSTTNQFIFQRQTLATEEESTGPSAQPQDDTSTNIVCDSPSPTDAETGADTDKTNSGCDNEILQIGEEQGNDVANVVNLEEKTAEIDEGQAGSDPGKTPESRTPPDDDTMDEDQAGPDPGEICVAIARPNPEPTHEEFMANVYPNVHETLKFPADEHVILEDPLSLSGTLSSMKNLDDAYTIGDQLLNDKSTEDEPGKLNVETEVVSRVTVSIYQASSSVPPLSHRSSDPDLASRVSALEHVCANFEKRLHLGDLSRDLAEADMKEILHQRMFESGSYKSHPEHVALYEAFEASMERAQRDEFLTKMAKHDSDASGSKQPPASQSSAWKTSDTKEAPSRSSKQKFVPHSEQPIEDVPIHDVNISYSEDTYTTHLPKIKTPATCSYQDLDKYKLLWHTGDMSSFINWFCKRIGKKKSTKADLEGPAFKVIRPFHDNNISLQFQMEECYLLLTDQIDLVNPEGHRVVPDVSKPLPLGGPPGQVTVQTQYFFNKDLEYLVLGDKERRSALSISKLKAAQYLDFGLEELVLSLWIESE